MGSMIHKVEFGDEELRTLIGVLKYAVDYCPLESISEELNITGDKVQDLIAKLEKALKSD
jgi:hypothetical protein